MSPGSSAESQDRMEASADDDFIFYLKKGGALLEGDRADEARTALERALELNPESGRVQNLLGLAYFKLGLLEAAKSIYDRLIAEHAEDAPLKVNLGLVLLKQGRLDEAQAMLRAALALKPDHARAHAYLGLALYRSDDLEGAHEHLVKGGAQDLAQKVRSKLEAGDRPPEEGALLGAVASDGLDLLDSVDNPFEASVDERGARNEAGWGTLVAHSIPVDVAFDDDELDADEPAMVAGPLRGSRPPASAAHFEPPRPGTPTRQEFGSAGPVAPRAASTAGGVQALADLDWQPGFRVPAACGPDAWVTVETQVHLRGSTLIAASGALNLSPSTLRSSANPFVRLQGHGRCVVRVPDIAAVLEDVRRMFVRSSALAGFEGALNALRGEVVGAAVVQLDGHGSVLLNSAWPVLSVQVRPDASFMIQRTALLAWTGDLTVELAEVAGLDDGIVNLEGEGTAYFAGTTTA